MLLSLVYRLINVYYRIVTELSFDIASPMKPGKCRDPKAKIRPGFSNN